VNRKNNIQMACDTSALLQDLQKRITLLQRRIHCPPDGIEIDEQLRRARYSVEAYLHCYSAKWKWVPPEYYSLTLPHRAKLLNALKIQQLCKSVLMENKQFKFAVGKANDRTYSRYYLVVVQYTSVISNKKLELAIRKLRKVSEGRLPTNCFEFSVAKEVSKSG